MMLPSQQSFQQRHRYKGTSRLARADAAQCKIARRAAARRRTHQQTLCLLVVHRLLQLPAPRLHGPLPLLPAVGQADAGAVATCMLGARCLQAQPHEGVGVGSFTEDHPGVQRPQGRSIAFPRVPRPLLLTSHCLVATSTRHLHLRLLNPFVLPCP
jgi:hypothetical protein